ncbi:MAG: hypothetical protein ABI333_25685 [bacterium]
MDEQQRRAFKMALRIMKELLLAVDTEERACDDDHVLLRTRAASRLFFLSGGRGTGKTSVLKSVISATSRPRAENEDLLEGLDDENLNDWLSRKATHRIVWLRELDLEPLPEETNLLAALLARIDRELGKLRAGELRGSQSSGQAHSSQSSHCPHR